MKRKKSPNELIDAYNPDASDHQRQTANLLPSYLQTDKNKRFLSATLDKLIETPQIERINAFVGSKITKTYQPESDQYLDSTTELAKDYQLEPSLIIKDEKNNIDNVQTYDDLLSSLAFAGSPASNHDRILRPKTFSYDPHIDWDKFVNYNQYYWLEAGPSLIEITGPIKSTVSTYSVTDGTETAVWIVSPDGLTPNPVLTLYRGMTYVFNVDSTHNFYIKTAISYGREDIYDNAVNNGPKQGQVILTVDDTTPATLFYVASDDQRIAGRIVVKKLSENSEIDVEKDIIGKKSYRSGNDVQFTNGLMVYFSGKVTPESYRNKRYIVEGVGQSIVLVDFDTLKNDVDASNNLDTDFDVEPFDKFPFDDFRNAPITPEYVTINRASRDLNPWTRYNRWFHKDVITTAAAATGVPPIYPVDKRAKRPIIEFRPNIKLYNFGYSAMPNINLMDNATLDAFSNVERSVGYYVDGVKLEEGYRVVFNADTDPLVRGRIYTVKFEDLEGTQRINLVEDPEGIPYEGATIVNSDGTNFKGSSWAWNGDSWQLSQQRTSINQAPIFDLFDENKISFSNTDYYQGSFAGTKIFGYAEGTVYDSVLGLNLKFLNVANIGDFLFSNYFNTDTFVISNSSKNIVFPVSSGYLEISTNNSTSYNNVWIESEQAAIPILQYEIITAVTDVVEITAIDYPGWTPDLSVDIWVNDKKQKIGTDVNFSVQDKFYFAVFANNLAVYDRVLLKIYTARAPNALGYYEPSPALTNNPNNGPIAEVTLAEMADNFKTIVERLDDFSGDVIGSNNFRDLELASKYGTRLISHQTPLSFAQFFLGQQEYNLISSVRKVANDYYYYRNSFINKLSNIPKETLPGDAVDQILVDLNLGKDVNFPYGYSDMLTYGKDYKLRTYTVIDIRITSYSIDSAFDISALTERSILVYRNNKILTLGKDYTFDKYQPSITFNFTLSLGDVITIKDYASTEGCYVPPTPTKLGLFPKYQPEIFIDDTYLNPINVIQGHDGSITVAFNDYRDDILLEFETRIFNNIKTSYNPDLLDINSIVPGAYRSNLFSSAEVAQILEVEFLRWAGISGVDYITNAGTIQSEPRTYNYRESSTGAIQTLTVPGYWRGIFKYFYDTDRPHTHPWEMLGFSEKPLWWATNYGLAPYTSGNTILWRDIANGVIRGGDRAGISTKHIRSNLLDYLPIDEYGNLKDPVTIGLVKDLTITKIDGDWKFGDHSPAETAWRRSVLWPFALQVLASLTSPSAYASLMFDPIRIKKSIAGQYSYGDKEQLLNINNAVLYRDTVNGTRQLASGYSVMLIEFGLQKSANFLTKLKLDLANIEYRLAYKAEGFLSKDKLKVVIDSVDPTSTNPGVLLPAEDYTIILSKSNPISTFRISGVIVQKSEGYWVVRGYDRYKPYFEIVEAIHGLADSEIRVGGKGENYLTWTENKFYQSGQVVFYSNVFYRTKLSHTSGTSFDVTKFQQLPSLPITGGVSVAKSKNYGTNIVKVPYGTKFLTPQAVADFLLGYGKHLENLGFVFDYLNSDFGEIINWDFSTKEFLFWTTQNWSIGSIITLSPFADRLKFNTTSGIGDPVYGVADDLYNENYEFSLLSADGSAFPKNGFLLSRLDGEFEISTVFPRVGVYYAQFNMIQKQHAIVFNNYSMFNDIIYDVETGYRQRRAKLIGFRTAEWTGGFTSPGFVYDEAKVNDWEAYRDYNAGEVVRYNGKYYSAIVKVFGSEAFDFNNWNRLPEQPMPALLPNFDYKISQFEDFYSLDIDNFDIGQQRMAQHLTGYSPRVYLDNIFNDGIAQYKFYQGYIREKGTANAINKISKASVNSLKGKATFNETWAFRIGHFGGYSTYQELEINLDDSKFIQNPQIIQFTDYEQLTNDFVYYKPVKDVLVQPEDYDWKNVFPTFDVNFSDYATALPNAGYVRLDDITATAYNKNSLLDIASASNIKEGSTFWLGFREDGDWDILRYTRQQNAIIDFKVTVPGSSATFATSKPHKLKAGDIVGVTRFITEINKVFIVLQTPTPTTFVVATDLVAEPYTDTSSKTVTGYFIGNILQDSNIITNVASNEGLAIGAELTANGLTVGTTITSISKEADNTYSVYISSQATATNESLYVSYSYSTANIIIGQLFKFVSVRFKDFDDVHNLSNLNSIEFDDKIWIDNNGAGKFAVYKKINNYTASVIDNGVNNTGQLWGFKNSIDTTTSTFVVSAPGYPDINFGPGLIVVYERTTPRAIDANTYISYRLNDVGNTDYYVSSIPPLFGFSLKYDKYEDIVFAGAPNASHVKLGASGAVRYANISSSASQLDYTGVVKITKIYRPAAVDVTLGVLTSPTPVAGGQFGYDIAINTGTINRTLLVSAPGEGTGKVYVYQMGGNVLNTTISVPGRRYTTSTTVTLSSPQIVGGQQATARISSVTTYTNQQLQDNPTLTSGQILEIEITNPGYGYTHPPTVTFGNTQGLDAVVSFDLGISTSTRSIFVGAQTTLTNPLTFFNNYPPKFGSSMATTDDLSIVAVGAPGYCANEGAVLVYSKTGAIFNLVQTIDKSTTGLAGIISSGDGLGSKLSMSKDGEYLFISAPGNQSDPTQGTVSVWRWNGTAYDHLQNLFNPNKSANAVFGTDITIDEDKQNLIISSLGDLYSRRTSFNLYSSRLYPGSTVPSRKYVNDQNSDPQARTTTFDANSTIFYDKLSNVGNVSVFNRYNVYFSYAQDLDSNLIIQDSNFGYSVAQANDNIYVSMPSADTDAGTSNGAILIFSKIDDTTNSWAEYRTQDSLVNTDLIKKVFTVDVKDDQIQDYLSIIDPMKGKIPGTADQELTYKTLFDPAIYSLGNSGVSVDSNTNWIDDHIGELWWDTSAVKYVWYEQGELEYRKNNWGSIFPGSSIQVYEWVRSEYLPSEWAAIADTNEGLIKGISGQPKYPNNSVLSIKQVYDSITQTFSNVYYFWVKNKVTTPDLDTRRLSGLEVASLIADPRGQDLRTVNVLSKNSFSLVNIKETIQSQEVNLHINYDTDAESAPRHTEWLLLQENDQFSKPPVMLERKLIESLAGFDSLGNEVPDSLLSAKQRYGIAFRPRQSMFVDRFNALRNLITWTNSILANERIAKFCTFNNLNAYDEIPDATLNEYDVLVEDNYTLGTIVTRGLDQAEVVCTIDSNGKIDEVTVTNPGNGYNPLRPPTVTITGTGYDAVIKTIVNELGRVTGVTVVSGGYGFTSVPTLIVRPYTVIVQSDKDAAGFWTKFQWDQSIKEWVRRETQKYDTRLFWSYIDWQDPTYNSLQDFADTVADTYELNEVNVVAGGYVKVKNAGNGTYMILRKTDSSTVGTWSKEWDVVYEENGTIQITDKIWDQDLTDFAFDEIAAFDQTLFDQSINQELIFILRAIKDEIFVQSLGHYWNQFFFKAVKYALYEQTGLDWAFKTSFINVTNEAGTLDQRPSYKLQDSSYYEKWINEVKPYHTKIRNFTVKYDNQENSETYTTDFDLPAYFNSVTDSFETLNQKSLAVLQYPYRSWYDNFAHSVNSIAVYDGGEDYITPPTVKIISAPGDLGSGATARAYISLGRVYEIEVTNPGSGYTLTPTVYLEGGLGLTGKTARASAYLENGKVRSNNLTLKFDRIGYGREIVDRSYVDQFIGDGEAYSFTLTWVPQLDRNSIVVKQNNTLVLNDKFTIEHYTEEFTNTNGLTYTKRYGRLLLNFVPSINFVLTVDYLKDVKFLSAYDRVEEYYAPLPGMPGKDPEQLMKGLSYGGVKVDTLPFSYSSAWDTLKYWEGAWDSYSAETNYGIVKNPQSGYESQLLALQSEAANASSTLIFWQNRFVQLSADLSGVAPFIVIGSGFGTQYIPNPQFSYLLNLLGQAQSQISFWTGLKNELDNEVVYIQQGLVPVTTPFDVGTGAYINVYLNSGTGVVVRIDQNTSTAVTQTIIGQGTTATVYVPLTSFNTTTDNLIIFRDQNSDGTVLPADPDALDIVIDGGPLDSITLGILPADINIDGYKFLDPSSSYAPEELLPGQVQEAIGITVFEQKTQASPYILNRRYELTSNVTYPIGMKVASTASVFVVADTTPLRIYRDYTVNTIANTITLTSPATTQTWLSITSLTEGGIGLLDYQIVTDRNSTSTTVVSAASLSSIKDAYVTVNGIETTRFFIEAAPGRAKNKNPKGAVRVLHDTIGTKEIQVWMFSAESKAYSQVHEQIFANVSNTINEFTLTNPPGVVLPHHSQVIVEWNKKRLVPPQTSYYVVEEGKYEYDVSPNDPIVSGQVDLRVIEVYKNGEKLIPSIDYQLTPPPTRVLFGAEKIKAGDALAIVILRFHDYEIQDGKVVLTSAVPRDQAGALTDTLRVITFNNHDADGIRKEKFQSNRRGRYTLSREISNSNYIWVEYNRKPLINEIDYVLTDNNKTVKIRDDLYEGVDDEIIITSLNDNSYSGATAYRMFTDIVGRTSYKRLSLKNTTRLAQPLVGTDKTITVTDSSVLTPPAPEKNLPGIVYIAGERIEFFAVAGNVLSQLRRGTLGTGILDGYPTGTLVIDQGKAQNLPVTDTTEIEKFVSTITTNIYTLTSIAITGVTNKLWIDPITGLTQSIDAPPLTDLFTINYGGMPLLKPTTNPVTTSSLAVAYDSGETNTFGVHSTGTIIPQFTMSSVIINSVERPVVHFDFDIQPGVEVTVLKRTGKIFENTAVFKFLEESPAPLPTDDYYPGDPVIILETGAILTDEIENPLEGI
jgi:hypothetical protein